MIGSDFQQVSVVDFTTRLLSEYNAITHT